jgi:hypothetical protein
VNAPRVRTAYEIAAVALTADISRPGDRARVQRALTTGRSQHETAVAVIETIQQMERRVGYHQAVEILAACLLVPSAAQRTGSANLADTSLDLS